MAYQKVRPLDPEFIEHVLPKLPPMHFKAATITKADTIKFTNRLTEAKQHALTTYWSNLEESVKIDDIQIQLRDGVETTLRVYTPKDHAADEKRPVVYAMHGGAFISGSIESEDLICRQFCATAGAVVFSIEYRLAPEHKVVDGMFADAEDGLKWTHENASKYGGDVSSGIVLDGTSSGGAMAAMCAYRAIGRGIKLRGLILRQPALILGSYEELVPTDWLPSLTSRVENWDAPLLSGNSMQNTRSFLEVSEEEAANPYNFPIFASLEELRHFPPTYFCEAECDPLVDESILLARRLREANVPVREKLYKGMPHGFHAHHILVTARQEMADTAEGLKWCLEQAN